MTRWRAEIRRHMAPFCRSCDYRMIREPGGFRCACCGGYYGIVRGQVVPLSHRPTQPGGRPGEVR